ncbi:Nitroreductase family protein [gamma proteobacterium HdN1]|nr:Nitroreductase family protein [gamma proteobacterium HdN1]
MQTLLDLLKNRLSTPKLGMPAPSSDQVNEAIACARRAPDHGKLRPWRFFVLQDEALTQLGQVFEQAGRAKNPEINDTAAERLRSLPLRAPMVIVVGCHIATESKIPEWEQLIAAGCAVHNLELAFHAMGFSCMWRTGDFTSDPLIQAAFKLDAPDRIVGYLYVGTALETPKLTNPDTNHSVFWGMP